MMENCEQPTVTFDQKKIENDINLLVKQVILNQKADANSDLDVTLIPKITVKRIVNNRIVTNVYTLDDF